MQAPYSHPITLEKAKQLMAGDLSDVYRGILKSSCAPIYWFRSNQADQSILNSGTVTFIKTPKRALGVTAAHVLHGYFKDSSDVGVQLQIMNAVVDDLHDRIVDVNEGLDLATFIVDDALLARLDANIVPLSNWQPCPPQEGRGIMLAGYPAQEILRESMHLNFGLFTALVVARTVTNVQITWLVDPVAQLATAKIPAPPPCYGLGGISGGPLITWIESENHIATFALGGIITEQPNYLKSDFAIERVIAVRADFITPSGRIVR